MHVAEKESGLTVTQEENARLCEGLNVSQKEAERLASENRILKRAVSIQNTKGKEVREAWFAGFPRHENHLVLSLSVADILL